jgi:hypothetical protein
MGDDKPSGALCIVKQIKTIWFNVNGYLSNLFSDKYHL